MNDFLLFLLLIQRVHQLFETLVVLKFLALLEL